MIKKEMAKGDGKVKVTFILSKDQSHEKVFLVGDFNGWRPGKELFVRQKNRTYSVTITLDSGRRYAFRYMTGTGQWLDEEQADGREPNGFGGENCVVMT